MELVIGKPVTLMAINMVSWARDDRGMENEQSLLVLSLSSVFGLLTPKEMSNILLKINQKTKITECFTCKKCKIISKNS